MPASGTWGFLDPERGRAVVEDRPPTMDWTGLPTADAPLHCGSFCAMAAGLDGKSKPAEALNAITPRMRVKF